MRRKLTLKKLSKNFFLLSLSSLYIEINNLPRKLTQNMPRPKKRTATANPAEEPETMKRQKASSSRSSKLSIEESSFQMRNLLNWFKSYTDDDHQMLGPEAMEQFCKDIGVDPEDIVMLVIAFKMNAKRMGYFSQSEFVKGLSEVLCDSPKKLRNKLGYFYSLLNDPTNFKMIFRYGYDFARVSCRATWSQCVHFMHLRSSRLTLNTFPF
jgi:hypothetical protein